MEMLRLAASSAVEGIFALYRMEYGLIGKGISKFEFKFGAF